MKESEGILEELRKCKRTVGFEGVDLGDVSYIFVKPGVFICSVALLMAPVRNNFATDFVSMTSHRLVHK